MSIKTISDIEIEPEQINEDVDHIFEGIKAILKNDEFGYFQSKAKYQIEQELEKFNGAIEKLLQMKSTTQSELTSINQKLENVKSKNKMNLEQLKERINSNVS